MLRITARWCICSAVLGNSSEMCVPGTEVGIARNGPPVSVPGFGSQLSSWLSPPAILNTRTRFCSFLSCSANDGCANAPKPPTTPTAPRGLTARRRRRRLRARRSATARRRARRPTTPTAPRARSARRPQRRSRAPPVLSALRRARRRRRRA